MNMRSAGMTLPLILGVCLGIGTSLIAPRSGWAQEETQVYGIANFGGAGQCGTSGMTHAVHTNTAAAFANYFSFLKIFGLWNEVNTRNNTSARGSYFTDSSKTASCSCTACSCVAADTSLNYGADEPDIIYVHTHGDRRLSDYSSGLSMGNSAYDCTVRTNENMLWNSDLDIAVIKACESGDYDVWANAGYRQKFNTAASTFGVWNAFHGDSSCGNHVTNYVSSYVSSSVFNGVGENWIDEAYDSDWGSDNDDCPVSIVMGSTFALRDSMFEYGGWLDRKNTGNKTGSTYYYVSGCDPANGRVLP